MVELARLGALPRVEALGPPRLPEAIMAGSDITVRGASTPVEGIDYALYVRRPGLDAALVETARGAGAEVRERARVTDLVWEGGRAAGVRIPTPAAPSANCAPRWSWGRTGGAPP